MHSQTRYDKPLVLGVHQFPEWPQQKTIDEVLASLGRNTGNLMFTQALLKVLAGAKWAPFSFTERDLEGRDSIILAAANWINPSQDFGHLAARLEATDLPVFLIGVGAQSPTTAEIPRVKPGTLRLLNLVKDRTNSIAARGAFTCDVLSRYGFKDATPTGCPSLLLAGPKGPRLSSLRHRLSPEHCCVHSTRHMYNECDQPKTYLFQQALKLQMDLILQSELPDMYFALGRTGNAQIVERAKVVLQKVYGRKQFSEVHRFLQRHGKVFIGYDRWIEYLKTKSFCVGTRFHCTVAALIAGTPATLITHDSRTEEMAKCMRVPAIKVSDLDVMKDISLEELVLPEQIDTFLNEFPHYYARFMEYFRCYGLRISHEFELNPSGIPDAAAMGSNSR
jgi:hypothetical protein